MVHRDGGEIESEDEGWVEHWEQVTLDPSGVFGRSIEAARAIL
jgi:hypothetical protein